MIGRTTLAEPSVSKRTKAEVAPARERLLDAAYQLFAAKGVNSVGIDEIIERSGCAKASLYNNFESKVELVIAFLDRREQVWTRDWLESEVKRRTSDPQQRLLAVFDVFDGWFRTKDFEGCSFINVLLEAPADTPVRAAAAAHLANVRAIVRGLAKEAALREPEKFAQVWHMLMKGSIVAACEGNRKPALDAKRAARLVLDGWASRP